LADRLYALASEAIYADDADSLRRLFLENKNLQSFTVPGYDTWLHYAAAQGGVNCARLLLDEFGFEIDLEDSRGGMRPVSVAADAGNTPVVKYLVQRGAMLDTDDQQRNPLFAAIVAQSPEAASAILAGKIDVSVKYDMVAGQQVDATTLALVYGLSGTAEEIVLREAGGDVDNVQELLREANRKADRYINKS
jgi:hypothetical protein